MSLMRSTALSIALLAGTTALQPADARITRIEITHTEPAFDGTAFGSVGAYERLRGRAHGEVDPNDPRNAIIQDIELAPKNARGMVEYATDLEILRPATRATGNGILLFNIINRGNKHGVFPFNAAVPHRPTDVPDNNALKHAGDGWLMHEGYTLIWFGWQADVLPGNNRLTFNVPTARNPDGSTITGLVRAELTTAAPTKTLPLSSGWFMGRNHATYPTVSADNRMPLAGGFVPTLTVRAKEQEPRVPILNTEWSFGSCPEGGAAAADDKQICYQAGFQPGRLYELIYRAKDPLVLGLGFAATRDLASFLKSRPRDDAGNENPVFRADNSAMVMGLSQSGRFIRSFIHLGFNGAEGGGKAYEGAFPHIGGGLMPLNVRFGQPGRAMGHQVDHLYPAYDFPFTYERQTDPLTGRQQGILDRCRETDTCPLIFHGATALEIWEGRQSLGLTDPLGRRDVPDPPNVRTYIFGSTQHVHAPLPLASAAPFGNCQQQPNPNPHTWTLRALLNALASWVKEGDEPPASVVPRIADGTLVAPDQVKFPSIPANIYGGVKRPAVRFLAVHNPLHVQYFGPHFRAGDSSGIITFDPPRAETVSYGVLVPQVDADGNDLGGIRSVFVEAPIGTYTGWNLGRADRFEDGFCSLQGSFIPFATTRQERLENNDPRLSIEERYPTREAYVSKLRQAAEKLVAQRLLLAADAARLIGDAERDGIRTAP